MDWVLIGIYLATTALACLTAYSVGYDRGWDQHETYEDDQDERNWPHGDWDGDNASGDAFIGWGGDSDA